jgi:hypothetical protein
MNDIQNLKHLPKDLLITKELVYDKGVFDFKNAINETESADYGACTFTLNGISIKYRVARITPTKTGQFVTIWKRKDNGPIEPFDIADDWDTVVISTRNNEFFGQFVFPMAVLMEHGIVSGKSKAGKRGFRVYPPWDVTTSPQAKKTQQWQLRYFLKIPKGALTDLSLANQLYASAAFK